jgi:ribonuclease BN (tRNA processing enzyme)
LGYVVTEAEKPGALDARRAAALGVKGKDLGRLKAGEDVKVSAADGSDTVLHASDFLSAPIPGRRLLLLGDTCDSSAALLLCEGRPFAAIVHESTFDDATAALALPRGHSTARMAGSFAAAVGTECLVLTHFSQRFRPRSKDADAEKVMDEVARQAREGYEGALSAARAGAVHAFTVVTVEDFSVVDLRRVGSGS